jgi:hypothetical protein
MEVCMFCEQIRLPIGTGVSLYEESGYERLL